MKQRIRRLSLLLLVACIAGGSASGCAANRENPPAQPAAAIIESYRDIPGVTAEEIEAIEALKSAGRRLSYAGLVTTELYQNPNGEYMGFTVKFSEMLSELFGIPVDLHVSEWDELIDGINSTAYDFTSELTPTPERTRQYSMTQPIAERALLAFSLAESPRINTEDDLKGLSIGFLSGTITAQSILDIYPSLNFTCVEVSSTQAAIEKLQSGAIDAFIDEAPSAVVFAGPHFRCSKELFSMVYTPIALSTANPEMKPIISVVDKFILSGGISKIHELYIAGNQEYNQYAFNAALTAEEADYLRHLSATGTKVPVSLESQIYPISFYNPQEEAYQGIAPDLLKEICALTGIELEIVTGEHSAWNEIIQMLESGEIALVSELLFLEERADKYLFSEYPYASCHYALISKRDYPSLETYQVSYANIGLVTGTGPAAVFESYFPNHPNVRYYQYHADAHDALERGEIDLMMASEHELLSFINYRETPNFKINRHMSYPLYESYFGFNKNEVLLHSIFNKAMRHMDVSLIEQSWVGRSFDYEKALAIEQEQAANQRALFISWLAAVLLMALIGLLLFIVRDMRKRKVIETQTAVINAIYDTFPDPVFTKDVEGRYTSFNPSAALFAERDGEALLGKTALEMFSDEAEMAKAFVMSDSSVMLENRVVRTEFSHEYSNGTRRLFESTKTPLVHEGKVTGLLGFMRDITEHKELLERIKYQSEYELVKYSLTSNAMNIIHFDVEVASGVPVGPETKVVWPDAIWKMLGYTNRNQFPDILGSVSGRLHPEDRPQVLDAFYTHLNDRTGNIICDFECRLMVTDGTYKHFRVAIGTMRDEAGIPVRIAGAVEDINEKKRVHQELAEAHRINSESLRTLESIMNGLDGMFFVAVPDTGELLFINDRMKKNFNLDDDCIGQCCYRVFQHSGDMRCDDCPCHCLDKEPDKAVVWDEKDELTGRSYHNADRYISWPDGRTVHLQYSVDMTELIEAKEAAEAQRLFVIEEHKRLQRILDILPMGVRIMRTADGVLLYANEAAVKIFRGESFEGQAAGHASAQFLPEYQPDGRRSIDVYNAYIEAAATAIEIQCLKMDGTPFIARFTTCRINYQGELCSLGVVEDVTAEKEHQEKLLEIARKEHEANQAKSKFLAKMSHEIRTPMNAIIGMSELALREAMSHAAYEHIVTVKQAGIHLLAIINDVLDFSKIEAGEMKILSAEYSFSSLVNDVISIIKMRLFDTQIRFVVNIDSRIPNVLIGDVTRIRQVLINIIGNAVKYTEKGFVSFTVSGAFTEDGIVTLSMEVKDSGKGIKEEDLGRLFNEYMQSDIEKNQGIEGVGLGLAISLSLAKAMGGYISVESEYGVGSAFTIVLPQQISDPTAIASVENAGDMRIIICERRKIYLDSIGKTLDDLGIAYVPVTSVAELCERTSAERFPFIMLSYALFDANSASISKAAGRARIILLSEFGEAIPEGNWSVLTLPVHALPIANVLNGVAGTHHYRSSGTESITPFTAPNARILVVDDINTNLKVAEGLLKPYGVTVDLCKSGAEAIEAVQKNDYDLVFMDHRMPGMDGMEATQRIRAIADAGSRYTALPIIALTANAVSGMRETFLEDGFDDFLSKPIDTNKLGGILEKWLRGKPGKKADTAGQAGEKAPAADMHVEGLDVEKGLLHAGGEVSLYYETLEVFCGDGDERAELIRACLAAGDLRTYTIHVHALKSALASIGASKLSDAARDLEAAGNSGDTGYIERYNENFLGTLAKLVDDIRNLLSAEEPDSRSDREAFAEALDKLKLALEAMDARAIKALGDILRETAPKEHVEAVKGMMRCILLSEYDEAVNAIEAMLQNLK